LKTETVAPKGRNKGVKSHKPCRKKTPGRLCPKLGGWGAVKLISRGGCAKQGVPGLKTL